MTDSKTSRTQPKKTRTYRAVNGLNLPPDDTRYEKGDTITKVRGPVTRAALDAMVASGDVEVKD